MRVIVTGASGFLGSWICRILSTNHEVTALVRPTSNIYRLSRISPLTISPIEVEDWENYIAINKPDALILADWWGVGNQERDDDRQFTNVSRMVSLAEIAKKVGAHIVIGVGSQAELGPVSHAITEELPDHPTTKYGEAKVQARQDLEKTFVGSKTRFAWLRIFSTYGPLDTGAWLIPQLVDSISAGKEMNLTKGEQEWSYLHAYDLANAFKYVVEDDQISGIINVGNPETILLKDAVIHVAKVFNANTLLNLGAVPYREDQVMLLKPICEKLTNIGWKPEVSFVEGIQQTISWLLKNDSSQLNLKNGDQLNFSLPARQ